MSGDSKIGPVGAIVRTAGLRNTSSEGPAPMRRAASSVATREALPTTRLVGIATELAAKGAPVDMGRVAELRHAIASSSYAIDAGATAKAMLDFHQGGAS